MSADDIQVVVFLAYFGISALVGIWASFCSDAPQEAVIIGALLWPMLIPFAVIDGIRVLFERHSWTKVRRWLWRYEHEIDRS